ncbi:MAG: hypothetical protein E7447_03550 [Ruminococcaceae bacterium]|nr:hypothetical protein [Oscillospiraceae bacterium]
MAEVYIPTLHTFAMENTFTGSCGMFRFRIVPQVEKISGSKEIDFPQSSMVAEFWHGKFCYEKSEMEGKEVFPLTEEGRNAMKAWLEAHI